MTEKQLLDFIGTAALKGTIILAVAGLVTIAWRSASAAARHLVWTVAVCAALGIPVIGAVINSLDAPRIEITTWNEIVPPEAPASSAPSADAHVSAPAIAAVTEGAATPVEAPTMLSIEPVVNAPKVLPRPSLSERISTIEWRSMLFPVWLAGMLLALIPLATARVRVAMINRKGRSIESGRWHELIASTPQIAHLARRVRILESDETAMPMTWGVLRPTLLVPARAERWPDWQCRDILLHELAHVERRDCLTQLIAQIACAVYWFNPLAWVASHRMRVERELACDDRVIVAGSRASDYASNLLDVARSLRAPSLTSQGAIAMARPSQLSGRLLAVLDSNRNRRSVTRRIAAGTSLAGLALALPIASLTPASAATVSPASASSSTSPAVTENAAPFHAAAQSFGSAPLAIVKAVQLPAIGILTPKMEETLNLTRPLSAAPFPLLVTQDPVCWDEGGEGGTSVSINNNDSKGRNPSYTVKYSRRNCSLELRAEGEFTMRADLSDIETLSNDGWVRIEEKIGRDSKRIEIRRGNGRELEHQYWINGDRAAFDENARAWLARTLLSVERRTAFAASTRVPQIYKARGLRGVLSEIALMPSAYAKSRYYGTLLDMDVTLDTKTLNSIVSQASTDLASSDYYMSEVLSKFSNLGSADETTWRTFAEAAGRMKSDYYKSETLKKVLSKGKLSSQTVGILLHSAAGLKSDYYLSELLKSVANKYALNADTRQYYAEALRNIESDYYRSDLLKALGNDGDWDAKTSEYVLASVAAIKSDYYKSESLASLVKSKHVGDWSSYFSAVSSIDSDYYKKEAMSAALRQTLLNREVVAGILGVAAKMKSDNEIADVLSMVARKFKIDDSLRPAYEKAVDAMDSDYYRGSALSALRRNAANQ
jgi:beta-lactamase regulating signal transducer with metallopeptidase domain